MTLRILSAFLLVLATLLLCGDSNGAVTQEQVKRRINAQNAYKYVGIGGKYGRLLAIVSKENVIESDHFPPYAVYPSAKSSAIAKITVTNMAAVSLLKSDHATFITTGRAYAVQNFHQMMKDQFKAGNYFEAIRMNIQAYLQAGFLNSIKKGVFDALYYHKANGLLNDAQISALNTTFALHGPYNQTIENDRERMEAVALVRA